MKKYTKFKFRYIRVVLSENCTDEDVVRACRFIANNKSKVLNGKIVCTEEIEKDGSPRIFTVNLEKQKRKRLQPLLGITNHYDTETDY
jgi:hypothetical protein